MEREDDATMSAIRLSSTILTRCRAFTAFAARLKSLLRTRACRKPEFDRPLVQCGEIEQPEYRAAEAAVRRSRAAR